MPRTPLLAQLGAAARLLAAADRTGIPADELADGAPTSDPRATALASARVDRRAFLGAAALGVGLAACGDDPRRALAPTAPRLGRTSASGPRVAVVGAGLAGLTATLRLRQAGVAATLYEADARRLGGRCWTERATFADGPLGERQIAERGGELIDQSHTSIRQLAQELGLQLDNVAAAEPNGTEPRYHFDGREYSLVQATRDLKPVWQPLHRDYVEAGYPTLYAQSTPRGRALDRMSVAEWIDRTVPGGLGSSLGQLLDVAYAIEYGAESGDQSALNLVYLMGAIGQGQLRLFGPSNEKYTVRGGNDLLVARMAAQLQGQIQPGVPLVGLRRSGARWTLHFQGRASETVDHVVLALPFSILRSLDYALADFPERKRTAIEQLGMGANCKLALQFDTRRWVTAQRCNGETLADTGYQHTWEVTRAQRGTRGILLNYTGAAAARAQSQQRAAGASDAALAAQFLQRVEPVLPGLAGAWNGRAQLEDWPGAQWARGSYSYWRVGQYQRFAGAEGEAVGSCVFAGEHTSVDAQGYLEGAVESGERAAREVLAAVGVKRA